MAEKRTHNRILVSNRSARHDYEILETYEAGIELKGTEVKSLRLAKANLREAYCAVKDGQAFIYGMHISPYEQGNIFNTEPLRDRRLLLHKREILKIFNQVKLEGLTLIPLQVYLKEGRVKLEIALAKGKKLYDKRADTAKRDALREMERDFSRDRRRDL